MANCPICQKEMKSASIKRHVEGFHTNNEADGVITVTSRAKALVGGGWDPYENTSQPKWDDNRERFRHIRAPVDRRGVWDTDPDSINATYDPRSAYQKALGARNPHTPNFEPRRQATRPVPWGNGFKQVFAPTVANTKQGTRGLPVLRRVEEREVYIG